MDHLVRPNDRIPIDNVPAFESALHLYDGLGFESFPSRTGRSSRDPSSQRTHAWFIQGWLYFGLLREIFGDSLQVEDFVRPIPPGRLQTVPYQWLLTTAKLPDYFERPHKLNRSILAPYVPTKTTNKLVDLFTFVVEQCNWFDHAQTGYDEEMPAVLLSVRILIQTFDTYIEPYSYISFRNHIPNTIYEQDCLSTKPIQRHMLLQRSAWCPHQVQYLVKTFTYHALIYLAEMKRDVAEWVDHSRCSAESRCIAYNIDNGTFKGRHAEKCSGCSQVEAPLEEMMSILEDGDIPLLRCHRKADSPGELSLSYAKLSSSTQFTAVSHLWSDGLGTPSLNSLPRCQLQRLVDRIQAAESYGHGWFERGITKCLPSTSSAESTLLWLDVYCVPSSTSSTDIQRNGRLKAAAIGRMVPTYALARQTLVLDYELQNYTPATTDPVRAAAEEELLARVVVSGWRSRCWTHQESQLSRRILIQCRGSAVAFDHALLRPSVPKSQIAKELNCVANEMLAWRNQNYVEAGWRILFYVKNTLVIPKLKTVWSSFHGKTTSQPQDALGVLANIMRLSAAQISSMPVEDQMRAILRAAIDQEGRLPAGIFFCPTPRMPSTGRLYDSDRWIPRFPGEGGDLDYGAGFAKAIPTGFYLPIDQFSKGRRGCFGLKVPKPELTTFHVPFNCKLLEVSLCIHEQLVQFPEDVTHLFLALAMPQSETAFEGVGACLIPLSNNPVCLVPSIGARWFFDTVWYCSLRFRQIDDDTAYALAPEQMEAATLPQELESRDVVIRSGKYIKCCEIGDLLTMVRTAWYSWDTPKSLLGRRSASMTFWAWCNFWGFPSMFIGTMMLMASTPTDFSISGYLVLACTISLFHWRTSGLVERARWILLIQSYSADYDPDEQWWKRLIKQFGKLPGQNRFDTFILKSYAYWPWLLMTPFECLWCRLRWIVGQRKGRIRLDEEVPLQLEILAPQE